jgi:alpha-2-macroglobulin
MMSRPRGLQAIVALVVLCAFVSVLNYPVPTHGTQAEAAEDKADEEQTEEQRAQADHEAAQKFQEGDRLFEQQKWSEARSGYDRALGQTKEWWLPSALRSLERDVECSLKLGEPDAAVRLAVDASAKTVRYAKPEMFRDIRWDQGHREDWRIEIATAERVCRLLEKIVGALPRVTEKQLTAGLAQSRVENDRRLVALLDPDSISRPEHYGWDTGYSDIGWWWRNEPVDHESDREDYQEAVIPTTRAGAPAFLPTPARYESGLGRSSKILFLLAEIERLDPTPSRDGAAQAVLHRADLSRRLYGPGTDWRWRMDDMQYMMREHPSFHRKSSRPGLKEFWQLADDEARTQIDGRTQVITLPKSESPMALWTRIEADFPRSRAATEAIYQRGLYFQNRQQFGKALAEYRRLIARFPDAGQTPLATRQIANIEHSDVLLGKTGVYAQGLKPKFWFATRNAQKIDFTIRRLDLRGYLKKSPDGVRTFELLEDSLWTPRMFASDPKDAEETQTVTPFLGATVASWSEAVARTDTPEVHTTQAPIAEAGAYIVEARLRGSNQTSRGLVVITDAALVFKRLADKVLLWVVDPVTGQPIAGRKFEVRCSGTKSAVVTDANGLAEWAPPPKLRDQAHIHEAVAVMETGGGGLILSPVEWDTHPQFGRPQHDLFGITDRPLYRPGSTVHFRIWLRELAGRQYQRAKPGVKCRVDLYGPPYSKNQLKSFELVTDEAGSVTGTITLDRAARLGEYALSVPGYPGQTWHDGVQFRVEDYKKPEFEVTVTPTPKAVRLGEPIRAKVQARYYFGKPVAGAAVRYTVMREDYRARFAVPREWDWLYGNGFGDYEYDYWWFRDMQDEPPSDAAVDDADFDMDRGRPQKVADATAKLGPDGSAEIRINTDREPRDRDYEYTIEAHVTDESRRTIDARATAVAARRQLNLFAELDRGWYDPDSQATVDLTARSTADFPLATAGTLTLSRVKPLAPNDAATDTRGSSRAESGKREEEVAGKWNVRTGQDGHLQFHFPVGSEGQYRLAFEVRNAQGKTGETVRTVVNFWVYGPKFDGKRQRFGNLEIIPDRRSYQVGNVARLLVNTSQPNARVLMLDNFDQHWLVDLPAHSRVMEIPIAEKHVPNFFVSATLVANGAVHAEQCELYVPPVRDIVKLSVEADRPTYKPGEKGGVRIRATDWWGKPLGGPAQRTEVALTAFDKSLTAIVDENPGPRRLLDVRRAYFHPSYQRLMLGSGLFSVSGKFRCPEFDLDDASVPRMGGMGGSPGRESDPSDATVTNSDDARRRTTTKDLEQRKEKQLFEPVVRSNFADTAAWLPNLVLDAQGTARAEITYPDSLTTWRLHGYVITNDTRVGDAAAEVATVKPLLVRLQAPRFAVEKDVLTLSANVHNDLPSRQDVTAELTLPAARFGPAQNKGLTPDAEGNLHLLATATIGPHEQHRFDWPVTARAEGLAALTVKARTDADGDAMRLEIPVVSPGTFVVRAKSGSAAADDLADRGMTFDLPQQIIPAKTQIDVSLAPSSGGVIVDALPFLAGYPYGCVEQTMSRFYPTVLAADTLHSLGIDLAALAAARSDSRERHDHIGRQGTFDPAEIKRMEAAGLKRLYEFQHEDGGWGWWKQDDSTAYMTTYVVLGLATAADSGVGLDQEAFDRAVRYLYVSGVERLRLDHSPEAAYNVAFVAYVLSLQRSKLTPQQLKDDHFLEPRMRALGTLVDGLAKKHQSLNNYGQALLALALLNRGDRKQAEALLGAILKSVVVDPKGGSASAAAKGERSYRWRWFTSDVETNAWVLRLIVAIDPKNSLASKIAEWLVNHRWHGEYWGSTRDTALAVHALADYLKATYHMSSEFTVAVSLDGRHAADVRVDWKRMLAGACRIQLDGSALKPGPHRVTVSRKDRQPLYYAFVARYFDRSEATRAEGRGLAVTRRYYKLPPQSLVRARFSDDGDAAVRTPLAEGDVVRIGDAVEVELTIASDAFHEFLAFEDPKPAGFEPIELTSGGAWGDNLCANVELRDQDVVFFANTLTPGSHKIKYRLRAEVPGTFQVRPTRAFDMYNPEIDAHGATLRLRVVD